MLRDEGCADMGEKKPPGTMRPLSEADVYWRFADWRFPPRI